MCKLLRWLGLRYRRGRLGLHSPDPDYDLKLAYRDAAQARARREPQRCVFVYHDEFSYRRRPTLAQAYAPVGSQLPRAAAGYTRNRQRRIAASVNLVSGALFAWQRASFRHTTLLAYFRALEAAYPEAEVIFVALDNWPAHFHPELLLALQDSKLVLLRLPTYAPWTNPAEKVWWRLSQEVLHLHEFGDDWPGLQAAVQRWLEHHAAGSPQLLQALGLYPY